MIMLAGLLGAGMFYGDGMVTPAMSVLSALEGLNVATPALQPFVIPLTLAILFFPSISSAAVRRRSARCSARS